MNPISFKSDEFGGYIRNKISIVAGDNAVPLLI
jgi:hypothetical protein